MTKNPQRAPPTPSLFTHQRPFSESLRAIIFAVHVEALHRILSVMDSPHRLLFVAEITNGVAVSVEALKPRAEVNKKPKTPAVLDRTEILLGADKFPICSPI